MTWITLFCSRQPHTWFQRLGVQCRFLLLLKYVSDTAPQLLKKKTVYSFKKNWRSTTRTHTDINPHMKTIPALDSNNKKVSAKKFNFQTTFSGKYRLVFKHKSHLPSPFAISCCKLEIFTWDERFRWHRKTCMNKCSLNDLDWWHATWIHLFSHQKLHQAFQVDRNITAFSSCPLTYHYSVH